MKKINIVSIVGARPNFVKIAPFLKGLKKYKHISSTLIHTGQHYTGYMSTAFFKDFDIKKQICLNIDHLEPIKQMDKILFGIKKVLKKIKPQLVVVVGDVTSTLAGALAAKSLNIKTAHIEAGLRSFDWSMPEETNRFLTDSISDFLFVTEPSGLSNLNREGIAKEKIFYVGNIMIDSLVNNLKIAKKRNIYKKYNLKKKMYGIVTLHRPSNVDNPAKLKELVYLLRNIQKIYKIIYPVHPRTVKMLKKFKLWKQINSYENLNITMPLSYIDFLSLMQDSKFIITDSGGMQEETTYLGIPCFTLRENTERPITITKGTNVLIKNNYSKLIKLLKNLPKKRKKIRIKYWDGKTSKRIVKIIIKELSCPNSK